MLDSRKDDTLDELDDSIEEDTSGTGDGGERESMSISERRARRKARRGSSSEDEAEDSDDEAGSSVTAPKGTRTLRQKDAIEARQREAQNFIETLPVIGSLVDYLRGVSSEIQKVTWPTREQAQRLTLIVIVVTVFFSILLGAVDVFYGWWFQEGIKDTATFFIVAAPFFVIAGGLSWWFILREEASS
jgi:preprotein translocase subunit SecE